MFFVLSKIMYFIISPLTWILMLLMMALLAGAKWRKRYLITILVMLLFFSNSFLFNHIIKAWEFPVVNEKNLHRKYRYGIVLSGMATYLGNVERANFQGPSDRLWQTIYLYKKGYIEKIFLSGGSGSLLLPDDYESQYVRKYLIDIGIPDSVIMVEFKSRNTYENAINTTHILDSAGVDASDCLLITSGYHMHRSLACFRKAGFNPHPYPAHQLYQWTPSVWRDLLIPDVRPLFYWDALIHEWVGYLAYKTVGYI